MEWAVSVSLALCVCVCVWNLVYLGIRIVGTAGLPAFPQLWPHQNPSAFPLPTDADPSMVLDVLRQPPPYQIISASPSLSHCQPRTATRRETATAHEQSAHLLWILTFMSWTSKLHRYSVYFVICNVSVFRRSAFSVYAVRQLLFNLNRVYSCLQHRHNTSRLCVAREITDR